MSSYTWVNLEHLLVCLFIFNLENLLDNTSRGVLKFETWNIQYCNYGCQIINLSKTKILSLIEQLAVNEKYNS